MCLFGVQEWWGVNEDIKEKAMMLHQKGECRVLIPDIYKGKSTVEVAEAKHVRGANTLMLLIAYKPSCSGIAVQ